MRCVVDKAVLASNFSRHAHLYDAYANIQRLSASKLIEGLPVDNITHILEIGGGTGNYTFLLKEKFKTAKIKVLDISEKMARIARHKLPEERIAFVVADAEKIEINDDFDLITSNGAFQWFENIDKAIKRYKDALVKKGIIAFSMFGPLTFLELSQSLKEALGRNVSTSSGSFLGKDELKIILRRYFREVSISELILKEGYRYLEELLKKIKYSGSRGQGNNGSFLWNRGLLKKVEQAYKSKFGHIQATYQIFFCQAVK